MVNYDAYPNGQYDLSTLSEVEPGIYLRPEAGRQYLGALAEFEAVTGRRGSSSEGYRPLGSPGDLAAGRSNTQWYWFAKYGSPRAAYPGSSNHGKAAAVDINDWSTYGDSSTELYAIFSRIMHEYGFDDDASGEPWHWHYIGAPTKVAGLNVTPITVTKPKIIAPEEDDMYCWTNKGVGQARSYTVIPQTSVKHHADGFTKAVALKSMGHKVAADGTVTVDKDLQLEDGEFLISLQQIGFQDFVGPGNSLAFFADPHWNGATFYAPSYDGGKSLAAFREYHKI